MQFDWDGFRERSTPRSYLWLAENFDKPVKGGEYRDQQILIHRLNRQDGLYGKINSSRFHNKIRRRDLARTYQRLQSTYGFFKAPKV